MADTETGAACPQCGRINALDMRFCGNCGTRLAPVEPAASPAVPVAVADVPTVPVEVAPVSESVSAAVSPEPPKPAVDVPADPLLRMRERERLLTLANVHRRRGQMEEARKTLEQALAYAIEGKEAAPIHELVGDILASDLKFEDAKAAYKKAFEADPKRVSSEKKIAEIALRSAPVATGDTSIAAVMLAGGDVRGLITSNERREKKNPIIAFLLSSVMAGLGQFYNGQRNKAIIFFVLWALSLVLLNTVVDSADLLRQFTALLTGKKIRGGSTEMSPLPWSLLLLCAGTWTYAVVDAATTAAKGVSPDNGRPKIDKSGWEV